jgi:hypothetical protein
VAAQRIDLHDALPAREHARHAERIGLIRDPLIRLPDATDGVRVRGVLDVDVRAFGDVVGGAARGVQPFENGLIRVVVIAAHVAGIDAEPPQ